MEVFSPTLGGRYHCIRVSQAVSIRGQPDDILVLVLSSRARDRKTGELLALLEQELQELEVRKQPPAAAPSGPPRANLGARFRGNPPVLKRRADGKVSTLIHSVRHAVRTLEQRGVVVTHMDTIDFA